MLKLFSLLLIISLFTSSAWAGSYDEIKKRYPADSYIVGIAEVESSGDTYRDRRRSEILARLEIAKHIRVQIRETTIDVMCEGHARVIYAGLTECRNQVVMIVEETVDEVLEGSRIVDTGEDSARDIYYAVAVLPLKKVVSTAGDGYRESVEKAKEYIDKAKSAEDGKARKEHSKSAKEALLKGMAYEGERQAIEKTRGNADDMLKELTKEIVEIEE